MFPLACHVTRDNRIYKSSANKTTTQPNKRRIRHSKASTKNERNGKKETRSSKREAIKRESQYTHPYKMMI